MLRGRDMEWYKHFRKNDLEFMKGFENVKTRTEERDVECVNGGSK